MAKGLVAFANTDQLLVTLKTHAEENSGTISRLCQKELWDRLVISV